MNKLFSHLHFRRIFLLPILLFFIAVFSLALPGKAQAAAKVWSGGGSDASCGGVSGDGNKWSCAANWTASGVPLAGDTITFNGTSAKDSTIDAAFQGTVASLTIASGYSGTITVSRAFIISSSYSQAAGTFNGLNQTITNNGTFTLTAGTFTSTSGTMTVAGDFSISGSPTFNANSGTIVLKGANITCDSVTFNAITILRTITGAMTINTGCTLPLGNNPTVSMNSTYDLLVGGTLTGTGTLTFTGHDIGLISGGAVTGFSGLVTGGLDVTSTTWDLSAYTTFSLSGFISVNSGILKLPAATGTLNVQGFTMTGVSTFVASPSNMNVSSTFSITGTTTFNANGGTITFTGAGTTMTCNNVIFNLVVINKTGAGNTSINTGCTFPLGNNPSITHNTAYDLLVGGTLSGTGTLTFTGHDLGLVSGGAVTGFSGLVTGGLDVTSTVLDLSAYTTFSLSGFISVNSGTLKLPAATGTLNVQGFTITGVSSFVASPSNMNVSSTFSITGTTTFNANGGTITFTGAGTTMTCNNVTFHLVVIAKTGTGNTTINTGCNFPLGNSPTIAHNTGYDIFVGGTLSGTGTLTFTGHDLGLTSGGAITGFSGLVTGGLNIISNTWDMSAYTTFSVSGSITITGGTLKLPAATGTLNVQSFTITGVSTFVASPSNMNVTSTFSITGTTTFDANGGTITFTGSGSTITCNSVTFNLVVISKTGTGNTTVNTGCTLPLGNNPTITTNTTYDLVLAGTLSGTGTLTYSAGNSLSIGSGGALSGFTALSTQGLTITTATVNISAYSSFTAAKLVTVNSGSLSLPSIASVPALTISGGTFTSSSSTLNVSGALTISGSPTFNANSGTVNFTGSAVILSCNSVTFNRVTLNNTGTLTVNSNCSLPLGTTPTVANSVTLNGTLSGTGIVTFTTGTLTLNSGSSLSSFSGISLSSLTVAGATMNLGSYSPMSVSGNVGVSSGTLTLPSGATIAGTLTVNGGTVAATTGSYTVTGTFTLSSGIFTAPSGTLNLGGALTVSGSPTFNHNSGAVNFTGSGVTLSCNNITFNAVALSNTGLITVSSNCSLPLGANPTVANSITFSGGGTLSGTGTFTMTAGSLTLPASASLSGFSGLALPALTVSGATASYGSYTSFSVSGAVAVSSGTLTLPNNATLGSSLTISSTGVVNAPSGTMHVAGNFAHSAGTFNHNSGTVDLNGTSNQTISGIATTFNNLTKILPTAVAQTLTFPATVTETVVGTLTLNGYDTTARLLLRSSSGSQWKIDPQGSRNLLYLDVNLGNNLNATTVEMGGTGSVDSGSNTAFNFGSLTPNAPSSLGPSGVISNIYTSTLKPLFQFTLSDPNALDTVKFQIQISTVSNFASAVVDYTSALAAQAVKTFTVGQVAGTGTYTTGLAGQSLGTGDYYWRVRTTDNNGLVSSYSVANGGSVAFKIDADVPAAFTPTLDVSSPTSNAQPTVTFSTTDNVAIDHYQVKVDSGSFSTQTSPYQVPTLSNAVHTITVRAYDTTGNTTDGSVNVTVDTSPPNAFTPTLDVTSPTSNTQPTVTFSTTDNDGIDHYEVKIGAGSFATQTSPYQLPVQSNGSHTITVRAFDTVGNTTDGTVSVIIDTNAPNVFTPTLNVTSPTTNTRPTVTFSTTDTNGINHYEVQVDSDDFATHTSPYQVPTLNFADHTITVRAFDNAGNTRDGSVDVTVTDNSGPANFTPTLNVSSPTNNTQPTVTFSTTASGGIDHYELKIDGGSFATQTSPYQIPVQSDGDHTVTVRAFDTDDLTNDGVVSFTVDTTAPNTFTPSITSPTNDSTPNVSFSAGDATGINHYEVKIDAGSFSTQTSPYTLPTQTDGTHTITVRAFDAVGNTRDGSVDVVIDTVAPADFTPTLNVSSPTTDNTPILTFSTTDNTGIDHYQVKVDSGGFINRASPYQLPTLADGSHTFTVRAFDAAGNTKDGSVDLSVDISAPDDFTPTLNVSSPTNNTRPTVTFSTTDNDGIDRYEVKIDAGSYATHTSPYQVPTLANGHHTISVKAFDPTGNTTVGSVDVTVDATGPDINASAPDKTSNVDITNTTMTVTDISGISIADILVTGGVKHCIQDSVSQVSCSITISSSGTVSITATDSIGNESNLDIPGYIIEDVAPVISITAPTKSSAITITDTTIQVTDNYGINAADVVAISGGSIICSQTDMATVDCTATVSTSGDLVINAEDLAGNVDAKTESDYIVTTAAPIAFTPSLNVSSLTNNAAPILSFSTTDVNGIDHYEVKIDTGSFSTQTSPYQLPGQADGFHTFTVRAYNTLGNFTDGSVGATIDTVAPNPFTPTLNVTSPTNDATPTLTFSTIDNTAIGHYEVKVDASGFTTQTSPYVLPPLTEATHTITVRAFDTAGNTRDGSINVTIDITPPAAFTPTLNVTSPTNNPTPSVLFSTTDNVGIDHYEVQVDSGSFSTQSSPYQLPTTSEGSHTITVRAFDAAGNTRDGSVDLIVDVTPPNDFTPTLDITSPSDNPTPVATFATTDAIAMSHFEVQVDSGSITIQSSPYTLPFQTNGDHTFRVIAYDTAGNSRTASIDFTIESDQPVPSPTPSSSSGGGSSGSSGVGTEPARPPVCTAASPTNSPWLSSAVALNGTQIKLVFGGTDGSWTDFAVEYGLSPDHYQFAVDNIASNSHDFTISSLSPNTTYYLRVRAGNGCAPGPWSNEIATKTRSLVSFRQLVLDSSEPEAISNQPDQSADSNENQAYTIKMSILDKNGKPVKGAKVTIHSQVQESTSDENGQVQFSQLEPGQHTIIVSYDNYEGQQTINLSGDSPDLSLKVIVTPVNVLMSPIVLAIIGTLSGIIVILLLIIVFYVRKQKRPRYFDRPA